MKRSDLKKVVREILMEEGYLKNVSYEKFRKMLKRYGVSDETIEKMGYGKSVKPMHFSGGGE